MKWVKIKQWCELSGDTNHAVHARRKKGIWLDGVHCQVRGRVLWINIEEVEQWVEQGLKNCRAASG
ncbi:excisionase [Pseudoteredinibacter isoporae]|nr:excisionase [Pseudoteredinibacter isoporae]NIB24944.1 excisionase [Pseudoteredinibacter isoporae]